MNIYAVKQFNLITKSFSDV